MRPRRKMKPYAGVDAPKIVTTEHAGRYQLRAGPHAEVDKTSACDSRPGAKLKLRNARRTLNKRGRTRAKRDLKREMRELA